MNRLHHAATVRFLSPRSSESCSRLARPPHRSIASMSLPSFASAAGVTHHAALGIFAVQLLQQSRQLMSATELRRTFVARSLVEPQEQAPRLTGRRGHPGTCRHSSLLVHSWSSESRHRTGMRTCRLPQISHRSPEVFAPQVIAHLYDDAIGFDAVVSPIVGW